ncbi:MAG TPA: MFS transporter [Sphaerochaeta sp.]|nr:MFS transporter [Sphaerochaeta sp.]
MNNTPDKKSPKLFTPSILLFLISQNLSIFGSSVVGYAIIWYVTLETSSGTWMMGVALATMVPPLLISLYSGVWADRYSRKLLIMLSDGFIALATLALFILFKMGYRHLELLLAVSVIRSLGSGVQGPAVNAIFPQLVPKEHLTRIQGINQSVRSVLLLLSPAVGGVVLSLMNISWAFLLDVITAFIAIAVFAFIKVEQIKRSKEAFSVRKDMKEGLSYTFGNPVLKRLILYYACAFFLVTPAAILTPLLVERSFGPEIWKLTANEIAWTAGSLLGGLFIALKGQFKDKVRTIALAWVGFGIGFTLLGIAKPFSLYLAVMGFVGIFMPILATAETVLIQEIVEPAKMGRVFSIVELISGFSLPLGIMLYGPLADIVSIESLLIGSGLLLVLVGLSYKRSNRLMVARLVV